MMSTVRRLSTLGFLAVALLGAGRTAEANAVPVGSTILAINGFLIEGTAVAYDRTNHVYLVLGCNGSQGNLTGTVWGRFVDANGNVLGSQFVVPTSVQHYMFLPSVAFSADANGGAGGFLVVWHESDLPGSNNSVHARMVAWGQSGPYGPETVVNTDGTYQSTEIGVAYSTTSKEFLVAVARVHGAGGYGIRAVRVDNNANAIAPSFTIAVNNQYEDWPSVAYNPATNLFLVSYSSYAGGAFVSSRLVQAGTGQLLGAGPTVLIGTVGTWITNTVYNPRTNQFLVAWVGGTSTTTTYGRLVNADGSIGGNVNLLSSRFGAPDGMDVDYNPITDTYFLVSATPISGSDGGVELVGSTGVPVDNGFLTTAMAGTSGDPYPRIKASTEAPNWLITFSASFLGADGQLITGTPSGGGPPPPPPGGVSRPLISVDAPTNNAVVSTNGFVVAGWAADAGASSGTGVDVVAVWAFPSTGAAAILAGVANYGGARPDVAAALGNPNFTMTGYGLTTVLPTGSYTLAVYAHSTVNNSWNTPKQVNVTVQPPPSNPMMWVDTPGPTTIYTQAPGGIIVAGWAVDLAAASGPGVDAVHVWAYPSTGAAPTFVGWSPTGGGRPDVGAALGSPQWSTSGFYVRGTLPAGNYTLVVYAHSTVTGTFNDVKTLSLPVR